MLKVVSLSEYKEQKREREFAKIEKAFIEGKNFDINKELDRIRKKYENEKR